jgi:hypothetical protein
MRSADPWNVLRGVVFLGIVMVLASCGDPAADSAIAESSSTVPATATTSSTTTSLTGISSTTSSLPAASVSSELDGVLSDRSLLTLGRGDETAGRFRILPGSEGDLIPPVEGTYWVTEQGNVYTRLELDSGLIADEMSRLVDKTTAVGQGEGSSYLISLRDHYRGDEFQIGIIDLVRWIGIGPPPHDWIQQWIWFSEADAAEGSTAVPPELVRCLSAIESFDAGARLWMNHVDPVANDAERWVFPLEDFLAPLTEELNATSVCGEFFDGADDTQPELHVAVTPDGPGTLIDVLVDRKIYTDRQLELMFTVLMWPDATVGDPPSSPIPAPLLTMQNTYLAAIGLCNELPWTYSNFAAGDTYYDPEADGYIGPVIFASKWVCPDDVPEGRRAD